MKRFLKLTYVFLIVIFAFGVIGILYSINQKDSAEASTKINDAGNPGAIAGFGRQVVRTSTGTLYMAMNAAGTCEVWKSTGGSSWSEVDSAHHPSCASATGIALAIDSTDKLHLIYMDDTALGLMNYITISSDTFSSSQAISSCSNSLTPANTIALAVDSSDIPHLVCTSPGDGTAGGVYYTNRIGGSWKATVRIGLNDKTLGHNNYATIAINKDNLPEVSYVASSGTTLTAALGNLNNATSFTTQSLDTTVNTTAGSLGSDVAVDSSGNTWVAYTDSTGTNQINLIEHNYGDAWSTWQTAVTDSHTGKEPSVATNGTDAYVFYQNSLDDVAYDKYDGSWSGETTLQTGTYQDVHVKYSYLNNNQGSTQIDYLFSDGTDIYWDKLTLAAPTDTPTPTSTPTPTPTSTPSIDVKINSGTKIQGGTKIQ